MEDLKTGDLLLFNNHSGGFFGWLTSLIKWGTHSNYSHVAMILKDPGFIHPSLKGLFVWESTYNGMPDPQDGKIKLGVQITPIHECLNFEKRSVFVRKISAPKGTFNDKRLTEIHNTVYDKPYDLVPGDWIEAFFQVDSNPQKVSRFWCSALIGYIYNKCGIIDTKTDWSILRPSDFSLSGENIIFNKNFSLGKLEIKIQ